jgi:plasmid stabilization system protein ParE
MSRTVVFSTAAFDSFFHITAYIEENWGQKIADRFKKQVDKTINIISKQPYIFKPSTLDSRIRKGVISKQTSFFYEIHDEYIVIVFFWDNRQEPII